MTNTEATDILKAAGFVCLPANRWRLPSPGHDVTETEMEAVRTLAYASYSDCMGLETEWMQKGAAAFHANVSYKANPYSQEYEGGRARREWNWGWEIEADLFQSA